METTLIVKRKIGFKPTKQMGVFFEFEDPSVSGGSLVTDNISGDTVYLKMIKYGNNFTAFYSSVNTNWTQIGGTATAVLTSLKVGLFGSSWSSAAATAKADWFFFNETCS